MGYKLFLHSPTENAQNFSFDRNCQIYYKIKTKYEHTRTAGGSLWKNSVPDTPQFDFKLFH